MKAKIISGLTFLIACSVGAANYYLTNDLPATFIVSYWTNTGAAYTLSLSTNLAPGSNTVFSISTNGFAGLACQPTNGTVAIMAGWTNINFGGDILSDVLLRGLSLITPPNETVPQVQNVLKSYFVTGAKPTQANYWEYIDTLFWYVNFMQTNAVAAEQWAQQAAAVFFASASFEITNVSSSSLMILRTNNISALTMFQGGSGTNYISVTFVQPLGSTNFCFYPSAYLPFGGNFLSNTVNYIVFGIGKNAPPLNLPLGFYLQ
jgi:hypothetical protein